MNKMNEQQEKKALFNRLFAIRDLDDYKHNLLVHLADEYGAANILQAIDDGLLERSEKLATIKPTLVQMIKERAA